MMDRVLGTLLLATVGIAPVASQQFQLDPDFGNEGVIYQQDPSWCSGTTPRKLLTLPDGKLLSLFRTDAAAALVRRHLPNGDPDTTFGTAGFVEFNIIGMNLNMPGLLARPDGKVIITGTGSVPGAYPRIVLVQLRADGTLDTSFGVDGNIQYSVSTWHYQSGAALQPDGKILVIGDIASSFMVYRFLPNGDLDPAFGNNGLAYHTVPGISTSARSIRLDASGSIYLGGYRSNDIATAHVVMKLTPNGMLDPSFGNNGRVLIDHVPDVEGWGNKPASVSDLCVLTDGSVIVAGYAALPETNEQFVAYRLGPDGMLDMSFGTEGMLFVDNNNTANRDMTKALLQDGMGQFILVGHQLILGGSSKIMIVRFDPQGQLIDAGEHNGAFLYQTDVLSGHNNAATLDNEGRVIVANGYTIQPMGKSSLIAFTYQTITAVPHTTGHADGTAIWPNPSNGTVSLRYSTDRTGPVSIDLLDASGRSLAQLMGREQRASGDQLEVLSIPSTVASGAYHVRLVRESGVLALPLSIQR